MIDNFYKEIILILLTFNLTCSILYNVLSSIYNLHIPTRIHDYISLEIKKIVHSSTVSPKTLDARRKHNGDTITRNIQTIDGPIIVTHDMLDDKQYIRLHDRIKQLEEDLNCREKRILGLGEIPSHSRLPPKVTKDLMHDFWKDKF